MWTAKLRYFHSTGGKRHHPILWIIVRKSSCAYYSTLFLFYSSIKLWKMRWEELCRTPLVHSLKLCLFLFRRAILLRCVNRFCFFFLFIVIHSFEYHEIGKQMISRWEEKKAMKFFDFPSLSLRVTLLHCKLTAF